MSRRINLMLRKIEQAQRVGKHKSVVMPPNMKRKSLMKLFEEKSS